MKSGFAIGVDIENISRFEGRDLVRDALFLNKIFTKKELEYCFSKKSPAQHLAARFCGKEAVIKAINGMNIKAPNYRDIEINNAPSGAPKARISKQNFSNAEISISLSHCKDKAIAFALVRSILTNDF